MVCGFCVLFTPNSESTTNHGDSLRKPHIGLSALLADVQQREIPPENRLYYKTCIRVLQEKRNFRKCEKLSRKALTSGNVSCYNKPSNEGSAKQ